MRRILSSTMFSWYNQIYKHPSYYRTDLLDREALIVDSNIQPVDLIDQIGDEALDPETVLCVRSMPLPSDNWYTETGCDTDAALGSAPASLFALVDDGGRGGKRWIPVEVE